MNCLLVAATIMEITPFLEHYKKAEKSSQIGINPDVLISGIGLTASAYSLTNQIAIKKPDLVIQAGIAGCFDKKIPLGKVVAIKQETIADQSVVELNSLKSTLKLKLVPRNQFPYKKGWLINPDRNLLKKTNLRVVKGVSVNEITTDRRKILFYKKEFNPVTESMEGAALHYVCLREKIPFLQIRSISNYIGERNKKKWDMKASINNLNQELIRLLKNL
ncbi:MAG TPA: futalosine hydrolase [Chitinophagaceae bacterium]|nr:futalosine hydrolase [Chitinophagaceae bacterium]